MLYIASSDDNVYALDAGTGALLWSYMTGGPEGASSPAVSNGAVYIGSNYPDNRVYALNASNGTLLWSYVLDAYANT